MNDVHLMQVSFGENETFLKAYCDGPRRGKGKLLFSLDVPDNPGAEDALAEKIWRTLQTTFFNSESDDPYYSLEESLKALNQVINQECQKRTLGTIGRLHASVVLFQDTVLHFSQTGEATIYLKRGSSLSQMSEEKEAGEEFGFHSISSGDLQHHDILIFSSRPLPFSHQTILDIVSQKESKFIHQLKFLSRQKKLTGIVTFCVFELIQKDLPSLSGSISESQSRQEPLPSNLKTVNDVPKRRSSRIMGVFETIKNKVSSEKIHHAGKIAKTITQEIGAKVVKIIKKPQLLPSVSRRTILMIVIGFILIFGVWMMIQSGFREKAEKAKYYENLLAEAKNNISIAENRFLIGEKKDATDFLNKSSLILQEIETTQFFQTDVQKMKKEIALYRDNFDAIIRVENSNIFVDLSQKESLDAIGMIHTQDEKNYIYEPKRLFESLLNKLQDGLTIDTEEITISGAELEDFNLLVFITQNGQVIEYSTRNGRFERAKTLDENWKKGIELKSFNGEFIYLLDQSTNSIWKYKRLRNGYGKAIVYSSEGNISNAISFAIDGDIYVLLRTGEILKYRKGKLVPYEIKDQPSIPIKNPNRIFTLMELNNIYILDSENKRIVVFSKDKNGVAHYQKQIIFENLSPGAIRDFYIDKNEQKIVIMTADKIYISDL